MLYPFSRAVLFPQQEAKGTYYDAGRCELQALLIYCALCGLDVAIARDEHRTGSEAARDGSMQ